MTNKTTKRCAPKVGRHSMKLLHRSAPRLLDALQRLTHPNAGDDDVQFALAVIAQATGVAQPCHCEGLEALCEVCGGDGYVTADGVGV